MVTLDDESASQVLAHVMNTLAVTEAERDSLRRRFRTVCGRYERLRTRYWKLRQKWEPRRR